MNIDFSSAEVQFFLYFGIAAFFMFLLVAYRTAKDEHIDALEVLLVVGWLIAIPFGIMYFVGYAFFKSAKWFGRKWL
jgi:predicted RND superfamily exporter protein